MFGTVVSSCDERGGAVSKYTSRLRFRTLVSSDSSAKSGSYGLGVGPAVAVRVLSAQCSLTCSWVSRAASATAKIGREHLLLLASCEAAVAPTFHVGKRVWDLEAA